MLRKLLILMALGVVSVGAMAAVSAAAILHGGHGRWAQTLGLQKPQIEKLHSLRVAARKDAIRTRADLRIRRLELRELMQAPTIDEKAITAKVAEVADLQGSLLKARVASRLAMRSVLTPEQQEKLRDLRLERRPRRNRGARGRQGQSEGEDTPRPNDEAGPAH